MKIGYLLTRPLNTTLKPAKGHNVSGRDRIDPNDIPVIIRAGLIMICLALSPLPSRAQRIAITDFELNDITSLPYTEQERLRTASIRPLLVQTLADYRDLQIVELAPGRQHAAEAGLGYLFRFHDLAAQLGAQADADWIVVGQHSKPSFLFSYLIVQLIEVKTGRLAERFDIELKGNHSLVMQHGVKTLADKIDRALTKAGIAQQR